MVTPNRRRIAVECIHERFGVSERRACAVVGQHRSTQRRPKAAPIRAEAELREHLRDFARCHPRLGWRKAHVVAHREGLVTNPKRARRVWRDERLQRPPQRKAKHRRLTGRTEYNTYPPHQSLAGLTPAAYAAHWTHQTPTNTPITR